MARTETHAPCGELIHQNAPLIKAFELECDMIEAAPGIQKRPAPVSAGDGANPITCREVGLMPIVPPVDHELPRQYLRVVAAQMEQATRNRVLYARLARAHGLTNQSIGDELGITEARVRQIVAAN